MTAELEEPLAAFALGTRWSDIPEPVRDRVIDLVLDAIACGFSGRHADGREGFAAATRALFGTGDAVPVIGGGRDGVAAATMLNGWQITATTMCDVYRPAMCHVTPVVIPAAIARLGSGPDLGELLAAVAVAIEVTVRLCAGMRPAEYLGARWHAPGVIGPYGSATVAARLGGADADGLRAAWGAAGLQSAGTFSAIGTPGVKFTQARAALSGVVAADFAAAGHGASARVLTHPDGGLFDAYGGGDPGRVVEGLGADWELLGISLRRWPAASSLQTVVEAVLTLADDDAAPVEGFEVALPPLSYKLCAEMGWETELAALQSARWMTAVAWTDRDCWLEQVSDSRRADPGVAALANRVRVVEDAALPPGGARVSALRDGSARTEVREAMPGSPGRPLPRNVILAKLERAAGADRASAVVAALGAAGGGAAALAQAIAG